MSYFVVPAYNSVDQPSVERQNLDQVLGELIAHLELAGPRSVIDTVSGRPRRTWVRPGCKAGRAERKRSARPVL